ncbi:DUF5009 domain-containing protein [Pedobacter sp. Leaf176]|uniref:DUF5009 domain-containing protein n=1 Tax=Pedobacter sp. Leaf176 TaxID=1736286 RepID=UPI00070148FE|nr:DUF5009 domain-containing protein [Pedobacter sp. Leaf176]KQR67612.1 N-acetylglucosamine transporter [Pedobacter sp. Leaf176]
MSQLSSRILSIDVLRAITMFLMIFVNDVAGVSNIPHWIEHTPADVDGMGFSDVIFPAFLFIVGLSLPFAIDTRLDKGKSFASISSYILLRSLALILMGFFHVNLENYNSAEAFLPYPVYTIILTVSFFLIWLDYPDTLSKGKKKILILSGIIILAFLALLYKGGTPEHREPLKPHWWGILGIIGWAYLITAFVYLVLKGKFSLLVLVFLFFSAMNVSAHMGLLKLQIPFVGSGSAITLMLGGVLISSLYKLLVARGKDRYFWIILNLSGAFSIIFGSLIRPLTGGISKIYATPAWVFICMGITTLVFELLVYLIDSKQKKDLFKLIKPAGTSTLTCYLIPYLLYSIFSLIHFRFPHLLNTGIGGIFRSFFIAFLVIGIVSFLEKKKLRLNI